MEYIDHKIPALLKLLSHPARIAILDMLREDEACVCHLEAYLGYRQAYLSQQLAILRRSGLITDRRDGWNVYYRVSKPEVYTLLDTLRQITDTKEQKSTKEVTCPCPKCTRD